MRNSITRQSPLPSPTLENLACFSEANNCILIGSIIQKVIEEDEDSEENEENEVLENERYKVNKGSKKACRCYNLGFCLESGILAGTYRKTHPFKKENKYFSRGKFNRSQFPEKAKFENWP